MSTKILPVAFLFVAVALGVTYFLNAGTQPDQSLDTARVTTVAPTLGSDFFPVSKTSSKAPTQKALPRVFENGRWVTVITYSRSGFDPSVVNINAGEEIRFINTTTLTMRVVFINPGEQGNLLGISQDSSVGQNGTYQVPLIDPGVWNFYNLNGDPSIFGVLNVK